MTFANAIDVEFTQKHGLKRIFSVIVSINMPPEKQFLFGTLSRSSTTADKN